MNLSTFLDLLQGHESRHLLICLAATEAVILKRQPCDTGRRVDVWCVSDPGRR